MDINSDRSDCSLNDNEQCKFIGNVVITQGSLRIQANSAVIHRVNGDSNRAVLTGTPVKLTQKLDNGSTFNADAATVDYDLANETVVLTGSVSIDQPGRGTMASQKITYDLKTGRVESGGEGNGRVSLRMLPKSAKNPSQNSPISQDKP
jgi:lipopolysaccharide export system protein LptA